MKRPCYNIFLQIKQPNNFWNLNKVIFTQVQHLAPRIHIPFDTVLK